MLTVTHTAKPVPSSMESCFLLKQPLNRSLFDGHAPGGLDTVKEAVSWPARRVFVLFSEPRACFCAARSLNSLATPGIQPQYDLGVQQTQDPINHRMPPLSECRILVLMWSLEPLDASVMESRLQP